MKWIITYIISKFGVGVAKGAILTTINGLILTARIAIVSSYIVIVLFIFSKFYDLLSNVNTLVHSSSDDTVSWSLQVVASMGIWSAFVDTFFLYSPFIISVTIIFLSKKSLKVLSRIHVWLQDMTRINYMGY